MIIQTFGTPRIPDNILLWKGDNSLLGDRLAQNPHTLDESPMSRTITDETLSENVGVGPPGNQIDWVDEYEDDEDDLVEDDEDLYDEDDEFEDDLA